MSYAVQNTGEGWALQALTGAVPLENLKLRLFQNDVVPSEADTLATYFEASYAGYAPQVLTGANWSAPVYGAPTQLTYPERTFLCTGTGVLQLIYGVFLTTQSSNTLFAAERFDVPVGMAVNGDTLKVTPSIGAE